MSAPAVVEPHAGEPEEEARGVIVMPMWWTVPPFLADFECEHGHLPGGCPECHAGPAS